ncbi:MAG TPA: hypothetical protein VFL36_24040 [Myxococcales bacterium]|nr:hypothetical protein [Myxococcales bacterium]
MKAARTERDLESHRLTGPLADELAEAQSRAAAAQHRNLTAVPDIADDANANANANPNPDPLSRADVVGATPAHLALIAVLIDEANARLLWARSTPTHAVWCERRRDTKARSRDVLCVIRIEKGEIVARWSFE